MVDWVLLYNKDGVKVLASSKNSMSQDYLVISLKDSTRIPYKISAMNLIELVLLVGRDAKYSVLQTKGCNLRKMCFTRDKSTVIVN